MLTEVVRGSGEGAARDEYPAIAGEHCEDGSSRNAAQDDHADVEHGPVGLPTTRAPVHRADRDRYGEGDARPEHGYAGQGADRAQRDGPLVEHLDGKSLSDSDERDQRYEADHVPAPAQQQGGGAGDRPDHADGADHDA